MNSLTFPASVGAMLANAARRWPDKTALVFGERSLTFAQLDQLSSQLAFVVEQRGLRRGDRISLYGANSPEWIVAYYAIMKMGGVANPLNLMLTPEEAAYAMNDCGSRAVFGTPARLLGLRGLLARTQVEFRFSLEGPAAPELIGFGELQITLQTEAAAERYPLASISLDDECTVAYTSGTTGHPKGAVLTHRAVVMNVAMTSVMHMRTQFDVAASALPCSHVYGNVVLNSMVAYGGTLVLHATFDAESMLQSIEQHRCTMFEGVPTMYMYMLNVPNAADHDLSSLTRCTVGGQTMPEATMRAAEELLGCPLLELWGMTELGGLGTTHTTYGPRRHGSIGVALPHLEVRVCAPNEPAIPQPRGTVGELQIRGPVTMREYLGHPEATAETLLEGGWLRTGDLARIDENGFIFVVDRLKDLIITGGFNIYPAELERVLAEHPDVAMVAVGGIPDPVKGEVAKAYIVLRQGRTPSAADIERHCRERLAAYKVPRAFRFVDDLPKTSTGKIMRRNLRKLDHAEGP